MTVELVKIEPFSTQKAAEWDERTKNALAALSEITVIEDSETERKAKSYIKGARNLYNEISKERLEHTNLIKKYVQGLMVFEKRIDTKSGSGSEYDRVKKLLDAYADKLVKQQQDRERLAALQKNKEIEKGKIVNEFPVKVADKMEELLKGVSMAFDKWVNQLTLDNYEERVKLFKAHKPKFDEKDYRNFFDISVEYLSAEDRDELIKDLMGLHPHSSMEETYIGKVQAMKDEWAKKLPGIRSHLVQVAEAKSAEDAEKLKKEKAAELAKQKKDEEKKRQEELEALKTEQELKQGEAELFAEFQEQADVQQTTLPKGSAKRKVAKITAPVNKQPELLANIIYHCFNHPDFPGIYKKKDGVLDRDDKNNPILIPAVKYWVDYYIKNCDDAPLTGLEITEETYAIIR